MGKKNQLSPELLKARQLLQQLSEATGEKALTLEDRFGVIDRLIKIEMLEFKMGAGRAGAAFDDDEEGDA